MKKSTSIKFHFLRRIWPPSQFVFVAIGIIYNMSAYVHDYYLNVRSEYTVSNMLILRMKYKRKKKYFGFHSRYQRK